MTQKKCKWCGNQFEDSSPDNSEIFCCMKCEAEAKNQLGFSAPIPPVQSTPSQPKESIWEKSKNKIVNAATDKFTESIQSRRLEDPVEIQNINLGQDFESITKNMDGVLSSYKTKRAITPKDWKKSKGGLLFIYDRDQVLNAHESKLRDGIRLLERMVDNDPRVIKEISHYKNEVDPSSSAGFSSARNVGNIQSKRITAGVLAIFLGFLGVHKFYLGYIRTGIIQLVLDIIIFPLILISIIEGVKYLMSTDEDFINTYQVNKKNWF